MTASQEWNAEFEAVYADWTKRFRFAGVKVLQGKRAGLRARFDATSATSVAALTAVTDLLTRRTS